MIVSEKYFEIKMYILHNNLHTAEFRKPINPLTILLKKFIFKIISTKIREKHAKRNIRTL